jgi:hypothetical protein
MLHIRYCMFRLRNVVSLREPVIQGNPEQPVPPSSVIHFVKDQNVP